MSLNPGTKLGPYEIVAPIGAGGMGEVYKAKDTRLDRTVAIKVLPSHVASNPKVRQRFEREARAVSSLNHPHICTLYDIGSENGVDFMVMEHIEGDTLADRLKKGALPLDRALQYGIEIADALDKAHRQGVVHRDLKPGNIMLTKSGAKLLDFGLAKMTSSPRRSLGEGGSALPTEAKPLTQEGSILGTFQYMAPEQLEGKEADARTDLFAFGAVLYEMATGRKAFEGTSQASLIAAIMEKDPPALSELQPMTPSLLDWVVKRCLAKNPDERVQSAHDVMAELKWVTKTDAQAGLSPSLKAPTLWKRAIPWTIAAAVTGTLILVLLNLKPGGEAPQVVYSSVLPPDGAVFDPNGGPMALSPDGRLLAFVARNVEGKRLLWVRPLDNLSARPLLGTENAFAPFWSPDSRSLGFFSDGALKKIEASGKSLETLYSLVETGWGGTWNEDGTILFNNGFETGLHSVSSSGEVGSVVTTPENSNEFVHLWPFFLPDGNHFLYSARNRSGGQNQVYLGALDGTAPRPLVTTSFNAVYASPGYLLFWREGKLRAQRFDTKSLELAGEVISVAADVRFDAITANVLFSASQNGILAYQMGEQARLSRLIWFDRDGRQLDSIGEPGNYYEPRLSHDGRRLAVDVSGLENNGDIWLYDLSRPSASRFTFHPGDESAPMWSPDDNRLIFFMTREDQVKDLYQKTTSGTGDPELVLATDLTKRPSDWSSDGNFVIFTTGLTTGQSENMDLWVYSFQDQKAIPFGATPFSEAAGRFSPDGKWVAYVSDESGQFEIYVQAFPGPGTKWRISTDGGDMPVWRHDGRELLFIAPGRRLMSVGIKTGLDLEIDGPKLLFVTSIKGLYNAMGSQYDISPDGQRFLINTLVEEADATSITLVQNWFEELQELVPTN